jgi:hypothetical protein
MSLVYWFADGAGEGVNKGGPDGQTLVPTAMIRWVRANGAPSLIVYGGDAYKRGDSKAFSEFFKQMDGDVRLMCETPGNHDWQDDPDTPGIGRIPHGFETFWQQHPESKQPIDATKKGGARYEHFIDLDGWRLFFLDTGDYDPNPWPAGDESRVTWLTSHLLPRRANIIFAHHSRVSRGRHGNNDDLDRLWKLLFDATGTPRVTLMLGGHDHNVSVYGPRSQNDPSGHSVAFDKGIHIVVNGAGGDGHYSQGLFAHGTKGDIFKDDDNFCITRINLVDARTLEVDILDFGTTAKRDPLPVDKARLKIGLP